MVSHGERMWEPTYCSGGHLWYEAAGSLQELLRLRLEGPKAATRLRRETKTNYAARFYLEQGLRCGELWFRVAPTPALLVQLRCGRHVEGKCVQGARKHCARSPLGAHRDVPRHAAQQRLDT